MLRNSILLSCFVLLTNVKAHDKIATVSPISYSLTKAIVKNTDLEVVYLPPKRLPINRIPSWINKNASKKFGFFDAFVGISSVAQGLNFYTSLRQSNIRLVDIDIAQAIMPSGEKVVLLNNAEYFWLNSNNLLMMIGILKRDMSALWPEYSELFKQNYQQVATDIRQINLTLDEILMARDIAFIIPENKKLLPLIASLSSDSSSQSEALNLGLNYLLLTSEKSTTKNVWVIDDLSRFSEIELSERLRSQVEALASVLN